MLALFVHCQCFIAHYFSQPTFDKATCSQHLRGQRWRRLYEIIFTKLLTIEQLGTVACVCNLATWKLNSRTAWVRDHWRSVAYVDQASTLSSVSTWYVRRNSNLTRFDSEERSGPGRKRSRQKFSHWTVVG